MLAIVLERKSTTLLCVGRLSEANRERQPPYGVRLVKEILEVNDSIRRINF